MCTISGTRAYELMRKLDFPRVGGTEGERSAAHILLDEARRLGLDARLDSYSIPVSATLSASLSVISPHSREIDCKPMAFAGSTPPEGLEAPLAYVETGAPRDAARAKDAVALIYGYVKSSVWADLRRAGALGLVSIADAEKGVPHNSVDPRWAEKHGIMPGVTVSFEDGLALARMSNPVVRLHVRETQANGESQNVVVTIPGTTRPDELIVVGCHYDSVRSSHGVHDDLAGVAVAWELMRLFSQERPCRTLQFIAFGGEEEGLLGSLHYARQNHDLLQKVRMMVNLDVGGGIIGRDTVAVNASDSVTDYLESYNKEAGTGWDVTSRAYGGDNLPFVIAGVPAATFYRSAGSAFYIHTSEDSMQWVDESHLERWGDMVLPLLFRWANAYEFPFERKVRDSVRKEAIKVIRNFSCLEEKDLEALRPKPLEKSS